MSPPDEPRPADDAAGHPDGSRPTDGDATTPDAAGPDSGSGDAIRPSGVPAEGDPPPGGAVSRWRRSYGASPAHLLLHLAAIVLIAWALSQSFDSRYEAAYLNLAIWLVAGAVINDFVALPLYVGIDRLARGAWGRLSGASLGGGTRTGAPAGAVRIDAPIRTATDDPAEAAPARLPPTEVTTVAVAPSRFAVRGNGHVRTPLVMSAVLLLVYFPNITHKAPIGHRLSTGLQEQPDFAGRWLAITAGLLLGSAALYGLRVLLHRRRTGRRAAA